MVMCRVSPGPSRFVVHEATCFSVRRHNGGVWSISKMNMILHGINDADLRNGDTLAEPLHVAGGELMRFDRVITNPPFSQNYSDEGIPFPERFQYGWCPTAGKKADLMFVQHMVAVLRPGGLVCTVMPHGVLFRGGAEKEIPAGFIEDDLLEAVIGLAPNLFYGTGIPACVLVLRAKGAKSQERRGRVLFINADAEYRSGRAQSYLDPEHVQKIVEAFRRFVDTPAFATVVTQEELAANDFNLNIRRYADNAPPPEPQDVRAHLLGGVPKAEVEAKHRLFAAHGLDPLTLFVQRNETYLDFAPQVARKADLQGVIETDAGVLAREAELSAAFDQWWAAHTERIVRLPETRDMMRVRAEFLGSFEEALVPVGLLDRFKIAGAVASWWGEVQFDLKSLVARGFEGTVEGWVTTITTAIEEDGGKFDPLDHKLVRYLLPDFLNDIADAETEVARLDATLKAGEPSGDGDDEGVEDNAEALSALELKALKRELAQARRHLKKMQAEVALRLVEAHAAMDAAAARGLVLDLLRADLSSTLNMSVTRHRQELVGSFENWWDKYRVTLEVVARERDAAGARLKEFVRELGYAD